MDNTSTRRVFSTLGASNHSENERQKEDYYATPSYFIDLLLEKEQWLKNPDLKVLEPCAGECSLADRFYELTGNKMDTYDLVARRDDIIQADFFKMNYKDKYDVIITNPPYLKDSPKTTVGMADMILKMLDEIKVGGTVILLLKTLHLESKVRYDKIYKNYPPTSVSVFTKRISCYKNGDEKLPQGAISYAVYSWKNKKPDGSFDKGTTLDWINT